MVVFLSLYILIVGSAAFDDIYYQWDLNRYDLDKDGFFSGAELTKEELSAEFRLTNDVGRNLSVITGFVFAAIISLFVYIVGNTLSKYKINKEKFKR